MTIEAFGRNIGFRADRKGVVGELHDLLPPGWKPSKDPVVRRLYSLRMGDQSGDRRHYHVLYMNARRHEKSMSFPWILERLEADLQLYVAERAVRRIFVHAGVVAWGGKAILLPGQTMTGKTTLVEELLRLGATYYSDEYAVLSEAGRVYPFARPLAVRRKRARHAIAERHDASEYGAEVGTKPLPVGLVVMTQFKPGVTFRPRPLAEGKAVLALLENTVPARRRPRKSFQTLKRVVAQAPVLKGSRGDVRAAAEAILRRLE
jgi:hypothetical protein